jgi:hypothetical protein
MRIIWDDPIEGNGTKGSIELRWRDVFIMLALLALGLYLT